MQCTIVAKRFWVAVVLFAVAGIAAAQQSYPSRPIRFIVPNAPGGSTSIVARLVGESLTASWQIASNGEAAAGQSTTMLYLATAPDMASGIGPVGAVSVGVLASGGAETASFSFDTATLAPGLV